MRVFFIVLLSITIHQAKAQYTWYVGPAGGVQFASAYIEHTVYSVNMITKTTPRGNFGINARAFSPYKTGKLNTALQMGIFYNQRGWEQAYVQAEATFTYLDYLTFPFETFFYVGNENKFYGSLGFFLDFLVSSQSAERPDDLTEIEDFITYDPDRDNTFGYGFRGSLGYQRPLGPGDIMLEGYFSYSLSNVIGFHDRAEDTADISNLWSIGISIGYLVPLGRQ